MPIPSLTSGLRPPTQFGRPRDTQQRSESIRVPTSEKASDNDVSLNETPLSPSNGHLEHSNGQKRRSFLPQPGIQRAIVARAEERPSIEEVRELDLQALSSTGSTADAKPQQPAAPVTRASRLRPQSLYGASSARSEQQAESSRGIPTRLTRNPETSAKSASTSSAIGRSQSLRKPASSSAPSAPINARNHARTQSTQISSAHSKDSTETKSHTGRPKSLLMAPSYASKPAVSHSADSGTSGPRSSARLAVLNRSASTRTRTDSTTASKTAVRLESEQDSSTRRREALGEAPKKQMRPAFSTLQQHFTPKKAGKAPTSFFLHPPSSDTSTQLSPEVLRLQAELLQLHLLHESSQQVTKAWELSAKKALHEQFDEVASLYQVMRENEREGHEQKNLWALQEWQSGNSSSSLVEQMRILSGPLQEVPLLLENGGRFQCLLHNFSDWFGNVDGELTFDKSMSTDGLGDVWKAENDSLTRKLTNYARELDQLTQPAAGSSIANIVLTCKALLEGILAELQVMKSIEASVAATQRDRVDVQLRAITQDIERFEAASNDVAWRS